LVCACEGVVEVLGVLVCACDGGVALAGAVLLLVCVCDDEGVDVGLALPEGVVWLVVVLDGVDWLLVVPVPVPVALLEDGV